MVLVPAHDEAEGIERTVHGLVEQLGKGDRLLVVADNCSDRTAELAAAAGAEVLIRNDPERRGKGYAISFALDQLRAAPPETVVLVDADCQLAPGALEELIRQSQDTSQAAQADYLLNAAVSDQRVAARISAFAILVRNRVRPLGLARLGLPCQLTGSGMAFPWAVIAGARPMGDNIVEDLALGVELTLAGQPPRFCPTARVHSTLPESDSGSETQRRRWETGQLETLRRYVPRLLWAGLRSGKLAPIALGLDLAVPPLALLSVSQLVAIALGAAAVPVFGTYVPLGVALVGTGFMTAGVLVAFQRFGQDTLSASDLLRVPSYVGSKLGIYASFLRHGPEQRWVRTRRGK